MATKFSGIGFWRCACDTAKANGVKICKKCGQHKPEITLHKNRIEVTREPAKTRKVKPISELKSTSALNKRKSSIHEERKTEDSIFTSCMDTKK